MGFFSTAIKIVPVVIEGVKIVGDILDDGKRNNSNQKK